MFYQEVRQNFTTRENGQKTCARKKVNSDKNRYFAHCVIVAVIPDPRAARSLRVRFECVSALSARASRLSTYNYKWLSWRAHGPNAMLCDGSERAECGHQVV